MKSMQNPNSASHRPEPNANLNPGRLVSPGAPMRASAAGCQMSGGVVGWFALACLLAAPAPALAQSGIPAAVNYQGKLTDNQGFPVPSGYYEVGFRIWDNPTQTGAGNYIWGRTFPLNVVTNGMFNVLLTDDGSPLNTPGTPSAPSLLEAFEGADRYLGLAVSRNPQGQVTAPVEISPRQQLATAPFAIHAYSATEADRAGSATNAVQAVYASSAGSSQFFATNGLAMDGLTSLRGTLSIQPTATTTGGGFVPIGGIIMWSGTTPPAGWAICDGGQGTPDLRGRFVVGAGSGSGLTAHALNATGGNETHTLSIAEMPSHTHTVTVTTVGYSATWANNKSATGAPQGDPYANHGSQNHTSNGTGGGGAFPTMPPYWALAYIMRVQ